MNFCKKFIWQIFIEYLQIPNTMKSAKKTKKENKNGSYPHRGYNLMGEKASIK